MHREIYQILSSFLVHEPESASLFHRNPCQRERGIKFSPPREGVSLAGCEALTVGVIQIAWGPIRHIDKKRVPEPVKARTQATYFIIWMRHDYGCAHARKQVFLFAAKILKRRFC